MQIKSFHFNPLQVNCYVGYDKASKQAVIIDPACSAEFEYNQLFDFIEKEGLAVAAVVITHPHIDHLVGVKKVCERYKLPLTTHKNAEFILGLSPLHAIALGMILHGLPDDKLYVDDGDVIAFGGCELHIVYTPGHCDGSICLISHSAKTVFTGDVLFNGSIGRTDLESGDFPTLIDSIKSKLLVLPDDYTVRAGHGGRSSIGFERENNPYL